MNNIITNKKIVIPIIILFILFIFLVIQDYKKRDVKSSPANIESFAMEASKLINEGKYQEAFNIYNNALNTNPYNAEVITLKDNFLGGKDGEFRKTIELFNSKILITSFKFIDKNEVIFYLNLRNIYNGNIKK